MPLIKKNKFAWTEPWFFCQRIRSRGEWIRAVLPAIFAWIGMTVLLVVAQNLPWWQVLLLGMAAAGVIQLAIEAAYLRRDVWIDDNALEAFGNAGKFTSHYTYPLKGISFLEIRRSEEIGMPFAMLVLRLANDGGIVGIPNSVRLERLALALHELNVPVTLSGWQPPATPGAPQNEYVYSRPGPVEQVARVESIPEADQNLTPMPNMILALIIAGWLMIVWLGLLGWGGYYLFQNRQAFSIWRIGICAILGFASLTIPFGYIEMFGDYLASNYLIRVAKRRAKWRGASLIKSLDTQVKCVEMIQRENWAAANAKVVDFGFLQVDAGRELILFEGNKERWTVPFSAVSHCTIEEVQYGTGGDSITGQLRCYVALVFQKESGQCEIGIRNSEKEVGKNTDSRRMQKAVELFEYLIGSLAQEPKKKPSKRVEVIRVKGFDAEGEPMIEKRSDGSVWIHFQAMPPFFAEHAGTESEFENFQEQLQNAIGVAVRRDDREIFIIENPTRETSQQAKAWLESFHSKQA